jgi:hypothetical protein
MHMLSLQRAKIDMTNAIVNKKISKYVLLLSLTFFVVSYVDVTLFWCLMLWLQESAFQRRCRRV